MKRIFTEQARPNRTVIKVEAFVKDIEPYPFPALIHEYVSQPGDIDGDLDPKIDEWNVMQGYHTDAMVQREAIKRFDQLLAKVCDVEAKV